MGVFVCVRPPRLVCLPLFHHRSPFSTSLILRCFISVSYASIHG
eukprot:NODE_12752_length_224_cov_17.960000_g10982_i0.p1 GENE.NODE_12752_length_224_cov_17.960000_g10982_i0~~NODE_12752_length_224_cov_17.960000_g10982_i0.p1  ORF type:complete len:54 (-),score=13.48 NODE_12752_length_224_cov_17.960000_g10982_i0:62-193(-)